VAALASAALLSGCGPGTPAEFIDAAKQELAKNQRPAAIIHLRNALQKNPESGEARFLLGKALLDNGDPVAAEKELRKALQFGHPPDPTVPTLARAMMMLGRSPEVIEEFAGSEMGTPGGKADLRTSLGYAYLYQNKLDMAQTAFAAALAADPDFTTALLGEARIKANVRDFAAALELAERAVGKAPGLSEAWESPSDGDGPDGRRQG
jgi:tetratricopeptide (TPR) repeat protein